MNVEEKLVALRDYREHQYELLVDAVYKRRGWDQNGVPSREKLAELGIDLPEVIEVKSRIESGIFRSSSATNCKLAIVDSNPRIVIIMEIIIVLIPSIMFAF